MWKIDQGIKVSWSRAINDSKKSAKVIKAADYEIPNLTKAHES